jgi:F-type H+-transporting ATPase subunit b
MAAESGAGLLQSTTFWVVVSTVVFAIVAYKKGRGPILKILDDRTDRIRNELEEAERLRVEAQELLANYQRKYRDAMKTAEEIIDSANERAKQIEKDALENVEAELARKETQLVERIERAEQSAVQEIRNKAADIAVTTITNVLQSEIANKDKDLIDDAIKSIPKKLSA